MKNGDLKYDINTPPEVKQVINGGLKFLDLNIKKKSVSLMGSFFSGSVKGVFDLPFFYPMTKAFYINGTEINPKNSTVDDIDVSGTLICQWRGFQ